MRWRLTTLVGVVAAAVPAVALGAGHGFEAPPWMERMMGQAPPEMQRMMKTLQMRQMMAGPSPEMKRMMNAPGMEAAMERAPQEMEQMMRSPGMSRMMNGRGSGRWGQASVCTTA